MFKKILNIFIIFYILGCTTNLIKDNTFLQDQKDLQLFEIPEIGNKGIVKGKINRGKYPLHNIAVYIYKNGWYNKPYWHPCITEVKSD